MSELKYEITNGKITIYLEGRIDSQNAQTVEVMFNEVLESKAFSVVSLNCKGLEYISSAGLRIVLKLMKKYNVEIVDTSIEIYEIFEMTGFTQLVKVKKAYKNFDVTGCPIIGEGAKGIVYRYNDDTVIKVYKRTDVLPLIERERNLARKAFILGIPTAISYDVVKVGDNYASVFELLDSNSLSNLINQNKEEIPKYAKEFSTLLKLLHTTVVPDVSDMDRGISKIYGWYDRFKSYLDIETDTKIRGLIENITEPHTLIHGDYHTNNVMIQNGEAILIDMDTLSYGNPIMELANIDFSFDNDFEEDNSIRFLGITRSDAKAFYDEFLKDYFADKSEEELKDILNRIKLASYFRSANHFIRRNADKEIIDGIIGEITRLSKIVNDMNI